VRRTVAKREFEADICIRIVNGRNETRHDETMLRSNDKGDDRRGELPSSQVNFNKQNLLRSAEGPQKAGNVATRFDWLRRGFTVGF
jgi:hypothetical protein